MKHNFSLLSIIAFLLVFSQLLSEKAKAVGSDSNKNETSINIESDISGKQIEQKNMDRAKIEKLSAFVNSELKKFNKEASFSLRDQSGNEIIGVNSNVDLMPASIAKTVSTGCSLKQLGPQFQFETEFGITGKIFKNILKGDLVVRGSGDPSFVIEDLREIMEKIRHLYGIKTIEGNLVFDVSYIGTKQLEISDGFDGDDGRSFATELTAIPINQNSFSFVVAPSVSDDYSPNISTFPFGAIDIKISNKVKQNNSNQKTAAVSISYNPKKGDVTVAGITSNVADPKVIYRAVDIPFDYYSRLIRNTWSEFGGEWKTSAYKISTEKVNFKTLWTHNSRPLSKMLMDINKFSLNMGAELVLLRAAAQKYGLPAAQKNAIKLINECLSEMKISNQGIQMQNASGLSRETKIKTSALTDFLNKYIKTEYNPEYLSSLSILGLDGTAKSKWTNLPARARVKTGSLRNVKSIAGYIPSDEGYYSFALILNGGKSEGSSGASTENQIIDKVIRSLSK